MSDFFATQSNVQMKKSSEALSQLWIAHRGAGKLAPENTLAAFRVGASHGYRAFECDVKLSADGAPFLLHDATLDRTTSGVGIGSEKTWAELSRLDAGRGHSNTYAGDPLPRLDAIAGYCIRNDFTLNIEIKPTPGDEVQTGRVVAATAAGLWVQHAQNRHRHDHSQHGRQIDC
jgi:glycerophosphoryl diester phosphodiesterase